MRLPLAIASFVVLIVHGVVFTNSSSTTGNGTRSAYFEQARSMSKNDRERTELETRAPRIEQIIVTSFGDTRVDRCTTCHMAADDPRFTGHAEPLKTHPYSAAMGDVQRNGQWERRHKFSDFGCTVCHDGAGPRPGDVLQPRRGRILAGAAAGLRHAGQLAQGFRAQAEGQGVHGSQLRAVPHARKISPARRTSTAGASCSTR